MSAALLSAEAARQRAKEALARHVPGKYPELQPLKPPTKPRQATAFRAGAVGQTLVVKVWAPGHADQAARQAARQAALAPLMSNGPYRVPDVAFFDAALNVLGMQAIPGETLRADWLERGDLAILRRAGSWTRALHALSLREHKFRPAGHLSWLQKLMDQTRAGDRFIHDFSSFQSVAEVLKAMRSRVRSLPATRAITHRDLHLDNLISNAETLWGLDLENDREDESLRDVFSLGLDAMAYARDGSDAAAIWAALRTGYDDRTTEAPVRVFLQRAFALGNWARTPETPSRRQLRALQAARWILAQGDALL